jgi:hypothetical protein
VSARVSLDAAETQSTFEFEFECLLFGSLDLGFFVVIVIVIVDCCRPVAARAVSPHRRAVAAIRMGRGHSASLFILVFILFVLFLVSVCDQRWRRREFRRRLPHHQRELSPDAAAGR